MKIFMQRTFHLYQLFFGIFVLLSLNLATTSFADCDVPVCNVDSAIEEFSRLSTDSKMKNLDAMFSLAQRTSTRPAFENVIQYFERAAEVVRQNPNEDWLQTKCLNLRRDSILEVFFTIDLTVEEKIKTFQRIDKETDRLGVYERYAFKVFPNLNQPQEFALWANVWLKLVSNFSTNDGVSFAKLASDEARLKVFRLDSTHSVFQLSEFKYFFGLTHQETLLYELQAKISGSDRKKLVSIGHEAKAYQQIVAELTDERKPTLNSVLSQVLNSVASQIIPVLELGEKGVWLETLSWISSGGVYFSLMLDLQTKYFQDSILSEFQLKFLYELAQLEATRFASAISENNEWFWPRKKMEDLNDLAAFHLAMQSETTIPNMYLLFKNLYSGKESFLFRLRDHLSRDSVTFLELERASKAMIYFEGEMENDSSLSSLLPTARSIKKTLLVKALAAPELSPEFISEALGSLKTKADLAEIAYALRTSWKSISSAEELDRVLHFLGLAIQHAQSFGGPANLNQPLNVFRSIQSNLVRGFLKDSKFRLGATVFYYPYLIDEGARGEVLDAMGQLLLRARSFRRSYIYSIFLHRFLDQESDRLAKGENIPWAAIDRAATLLQMTSLRKTFLKQRTFKVLKPTDSFNAISILEAQDAGQGLMISWYDRSSIAPIMKLAAVDWDGFRNEYRYQGRLENGEYFAMKLKRKANFYNIGKNFEIEDVDYIPLSSLVSEFVVATYQRAHLPKQTIIAESVPFELDIVPYPLFEARISESTEFVSAVEWKTSLKQSRRYYLNSDYNIQTIEMSVGNEKLAGHPNELKIQLDVRAGSEIFRYNGTLDLEYSRVTAMRSDLAGHLLKIEGRILKDANQKLSFVGYSYSESGQVSFPLEMDIVSR